MSQLLVANMELMRTTLPPKEVWDKLSSDYNRHTVIVEMCSALRIAAGRDPTQYIGGEFVLEWSLFRQAHHLIFNNKLIDILDHSYEEMIQILDTAIKLAKLQTFA